MHEFWTSLDTGLQTMISCIKKWTIEPDFQIRFCGPLIHDVTSQSSEVNHQGAVLIWNNAVFFSFTGWPTANASSVTSRLLECTQSRSWQRLVNLSVPYAADSSSQFIERNASSCDRGDKSSSDSYVSVLGVTHVTGRNSEKWTP